MLVSAVQPSSIPSPRDLILAGAVKVVIAAQLRKALFPIDSTVSGRETDESLVHPSNTQSPTVRRDIEKTTVLSAAQFVKAPVSNRMTLSETVMLSIPLEAKDATPMELTFSGIETEVSAVQLQKRPAGIAVSVFGRLTDLRELQDINAFSPMKETSAGRFTAFNEVQSRKAFSPIETRLLESTTFTKDEQSRKQFAPMEAVFPEITTLSMDEQA